MIKNILITGATGLVGRRLTEMLLQREHRISHLGRSTSTGSIRSFTWNIDEGKIQPGALEGIDTIVHLAGAGVADKRWTKKRKQEILQSRTRSTALLFDTLKRTTHTVKSFISASAIGYYGFTDDDRIFAETTEPGNDFLARVSQQWEAEVDKINSLNIRIVKLRIGIVLSEKGGALKEMVKPIKLYAGAPLGSGNQYLSWIHLDDLCLLFIKAVEDEKLVGIYNAVGPCPVKNQEMTKAIAQVLHKPLILPNVPGFVLRLLLGEMANIVLGGSKISSEKIQSAGFTFQFNKLERALQDLLKKTREEP